MQRFHQWNRVARTVEKIRIAKSDVLRSGGNLLADICQYYFAIDNPKDSVVHRHDRAVPTEMLATAARFGVTGDAMLSAWQNQMRVGAEWWQAVAVGSLETQSGKRDVGIERIE
jgi:hypothetical protein